MLKEANANRFSTKPTRAQFQMAYYYYETSDPNAAAQDSYGLGDLLGPRTIVTTFQGSMRSGNPLPKVWYFSDLYFMALLDAVHDHKPLPPHANPHDLEVMAPPFTTFVGLEDGQEDWTLRKVGTITGNFLLGTCHIQHNVLPFLESVLTFSSGFELGHGSIRLS